MRGIIAGLLGGRYGAQVAVDSIKARRRDVDCWVLRSFFNAMLFQIVSWSYAWGMGGGEKLWFLIEVL